TCCLSARLARWTSAPSERTTEPRAIRSMVAGATSAPRQSGVYDRVGATGGSFILKILLACRPRLRSLGELPIALVLGFLYTFGKTLQFSASAPDANPLI